MTKWTLPKKSQQTVRVDGRIIQLSGFNSADVMAAFQAGRNEALDESARICEALDIEFKMKSDELDAMEDSFFGGMSCGAFESAERIRKLLEHASVDINIS